MTEQTWHQDGDGWAYRVYVDIAEEYRDGQHVSLVKPHFVARWVGTDARVEHGQYGDLPILTINGCHYADVQVDRQLNGWPDNPRAQYSYIGGHRVWDLGDGTYERKPFGDSGYEAFTDKARDRLTAEVDGLWQRAIETGRFDQLVAEAFEAKAEYVRERANQVLETAQAEVHKLRVEAEGYDIAARKLAKGVTV